MAIFLKNSLGKFWTINGKLLTLTPDKITVSSGGSFKMSNGDTLYLEPSTLGGDIMFSTESGADTVAFLENIDADTLYESGNGIFYDYTYVSDNSIWELRIYSVNYYEVENSANMGDDTWDMESVVEWYTGGPTLTLRLESGYWVKK